MSTIDEARPSAENLEQRLEFETLIAELSSRFINLPAGEVDREIENALRRICEPLGIDLAVLWQWSHVAPDVIMPTHVYYADEGSRPPGRCARSSTPGRGRKCWRAAWLPFLRWRSCRRRPPSTGKPAAYGIKSGLCLPLVGGGRAALGALGLNACGRSATGRTRW